MRYVRRRPRRHRIQLFQSATAGSMDWSLSRVQTRSRRREGLPIGGSRIFSGVLLFLLGVLLLYFFISHNFYVYDIQLKETELVSPQEVFAASGLEGMSVFYIKPAEVEDRLSRLSRVKEAHVHCGFPNKVQVILQERKTAFVWQWGNEVWGVDEEGMLLPPSLVHEGALWVEDHRRVSTAQGQPVAEELDQELIASVLEAKYELPEVTRFMLDATYGLSFQSSLGYSVRLGQGQISRKLAVWRILESEWAVRGVKLAHMDLRFPDSPSIGLDNASGADKSTSLSGVLGLVLPV